MTRCLFAAAALTLLPLLACGHTGAASNGAGADPPAGTEARAPSSDVLVLDPGKLASITVDVIREREMPRTLTVAGKVQLDEDRVARILPPLGGQILDLHVKVGDPVRKGEPLCAISSREAAAAIAEHAQSHKDLDLADKTLAMTGDLFEHQAASKIALQQAQNDQAKARSRVARADQELRVLGLSDEEAIAQFNGRLPIRSPIAGVVIDRRVNEGQFVQTDSTPIMIVADLSTVWVLGEIFERDLRFITVGQSAAIAAAAYPDDRFAGRINYVSDSIDSATRTAKVRVSVPNPAGRLKPEMFASMTLGIAATERALIVPARAVFSENGRTFVYAVVGAGRFLRRAVVVGQDEGADRRVTSGLSSGDRIVVDGALLLREEEEKRVG